MTSSSKVYFEISIGGIIQESRIIIELYEQSLPQACSEFIRFCENKKYKGTLFDLDIAGQFIQGGSFHGAFEHNNEEHIFSHDRAGIVSKTLGTTTFLITLSPIYTDGFDKKHLVIGRIYSGMEILRAMSQVVPETPKIIIDCGVVSKKERKKQGKRKRKENTESKERHEFGEVESEKESQKTETDAPTLPPTTLKTKATSSENDDINDIQVKKKRKKKSTCHSNDKKKQKKQHHDAPAAHSLSSKT
mmetsp:Transcript_15516/g.20528  ORF Transcript_15516/g.20528 Transcript_15516/m.20528 type:complete len:247 (-) Transcript_15516:641-1381(-)|eukprot:CAMPEP_0197298892 /NCGR_PEP_ID=MMETSP0890-20130614/44723_1 /TAXON_ID=44058 ORGANISM="Aureoumbra lagunensis, Strain CCMP1510" /NCGR_SAMPLE_ID=MMETSP0890 /ASSEMBLY_ACC=CAM_ASM_000533 /LENGTH=246 /DNA_ID=CAMNT_0042776925 /DNA_START=49 /DNA_END=789 /DNA_ORIENTATION=+